MALPDTLKTVRRVLGNVPNLPLDHIHVPPDEPTDRTTVLLHGRGADERDLLPVARDLPPAHVVGLRAPERFGPGYTWYAVGADGQPDAEDLQRSLDRIVESIAGVGEEHGFDTDRAGLLGFSQGAVASLCLLIEGPERYGWVAALHGYLPDSHAERRPASIGATPVLVTGGSMDRILPAERAASAAERLEAAGAAVDHRTYPTGHGIGPDERADVADFVARAIDDD